MIVGIGVDTAAIHRFKKWHTYSRTSLSRIFSPEEIEYCLANNLKSAERFAVRFAAKEAFYKAFCTAFPETSIPFLTLCRYVSIKRQQQKPTIYFNWVNIVENFLLTSHVSLTHDSNQALAFVILEKL